MGIDCRNASACSCDLPCDGLRASATSSGDDPCDVTVPDCGNNDFVDRGKNFFAEKNPHVGRGKSHSSGHGKVHEEDDGIGCSCEMTTSLRNGRGRCGAIGFWHHWQNGQGHGRLQLRVG
jgi:hypothetical protein